LISVAVLDEPENGPVRISYMKPWTMISSSSVTLRIDGSNGAEEQPFERIGQPLGPVVEVVPLVHLVTGRGLGFGQPIFPVVEI
jgi:hypothetical protein